MTAKSRDRFMFIAWAPYGRRTESLSRELGVRPRFVHYLKFQTPVYAPFKYILQSLRTVQILWSENPRVVFVQSPPFVCVLIIAVYCKLAGAKFVIDHHSASFAKIWNWALPIQRFLSRQAATNIVTNQHWAKRLQDWSAHAMVLVDPCWELPEGGTFTFDRSGFNLVVVNTFAPDEPLDAVLSAAANLPTVNFYITGNKSKKPAGFFDNRPSNVNFVGFVPDEQYLGLLRGCDAVMSLTTRDFTFQSGGCEAMSVGKPLITSDWLYLREIFAKGTIYVSNTSDGIQEGILKMKASAAMLENEMKAFRNESKAEWSRRFLKLKEHVN
jgi:glycosyltransferase involved in cell wall biosynthesis